jgi:SAM-dependent methyltransferase
MLERIPYHACPLCGGEAILDLVRFDCTRHPLYRAPLQNTIPWCQCHACKHVFTEGYFGEEALRVLFSGANPEQLPGEATLERAAHWQPVLERVRTLSGAAGGTWLDVGFGDGALLAAARRAGFEPLGIDLRPECVAALQALGIAARCASLDAQELPRDCSVISLADVLEHMPYPKQALERSRALLRPGGALFVSLPEMGSAAWRELDRAKRNPYWMEIEHYHNFSRARLEALLGETGFEPLGDAPNERYLCGIDVIARRAA